MLSLALSTKVIRAKSLQNVSHVHKLGRKYATLTFDKSYLVFGKLKYGVTIWCTNSDIKHL